MSQYRGFNPRNCTNVQFLEVCCYTFLFYAGVAELADAGDSFI
jgi:hypothetical protein